MTLGDIGTEHGGETLPDTFLFQSENLLLMSSLYLVSLKILFEEKLQRLVFLFFWFFFFFFPGFVPESADSAQLRPVGPSAASLSGTPDFKPWVIIGARVRFESGGIRSQGFRHQVSVCYVPRRR